MKEILHKLNNWKLIIVIISVLGVAFYWFEVRPTITYSTCAKQAHSIGLYSKIPSQLENAQQKFEFDYKLCLKRHGFK